MKTTIILPAAFLATALLGAVASIATAQDSQPADGAAAQTVSEPARAEGRDAFDRKRGDRGDHGGRRGHGHRHGGGALMQQVIDQADADDDGRLTQAEIDAFRTAQVSGADTDGDGALVIEEFEALYAAFIRDRMVDAFQDLDADGNGEISAEEIDDRVDGLVERLDRDGDGAISRADRRR